MPTASDSWYCEHIANGPWPFTLLLLPLFGAYFYGRGKQKLGWILIGIWLPLQITFTYVNNMVVNCPGEEATIPAPEQQPQQ